VLLLRPDDWVEVIVNRVCIFSILAMSNITSLRFSFTYWVMTSDEHANGLVLATHATKARITCELFDLIMDMFLFTNGTFGP